MSAGALLLAAFGAAPAHLAVERLYAEFATVCSHVSEAGGAERAALAAGWTEVEPRTVAAIRDELVPYQSDLYGFWNMTHRWFARMLDGERVYVGLRAGTPDGVAVRKCGLFQFDRRTAPDAAEVGAALHARPETVTTDFGGVLLDFPAGTPLPGRHVEVRWETHRVNPALAGQRWARNAARAMVGPARAPTLIIETGYSSRNPA